jgi:hypothetical protein
MKTMTCSSLMANAISSYLPIHGGDIPKKRSREMKPKWDAAPELSAADAV